MAWVTAAVKRCVMAWRRCHARTAATPTRACGVWCSRQAAHSWRAASPHARDMRHVGRRRSRDDARSGRVLLSSAGRASTYAAPGCWAAAVAEAAAWLRRQVSAGADGHVITWDVSSGDLLEGAALSTIPVRSAYDATTAPIFYGLGAPPLCHPLPDASTVLYDTALCTGGVLRSGSSLCKKRKKEAVRPGGWGKSRWTRAGRHSPRARAGRGQIATLGAT